ncbi:MAG: type II secretion system protein [Lentisphaerota bacterium]
MRKRHSGFTLLEILVVMVLTSMITAILLQGLQQVYRLQVHFGAEMFASQQGAMRIDWFRSSINGIMPDYVDGKNKFKGEPRRISGQTTAPLNAPDGALAPFQWRIDFDSKTGEMALYSGEGSDAPIVLTWPGSEGRFLYLDEDGHPQEFWPPLLGKPPQVPLMILLEMGASGRGRKIVAVPRGPDKPWPKQADVISG